MLDDADYEVVEVRVQELAQLFNSLDPSPFHERDLDTDAEEFIVSTARELSSGRPIRLIVHLPVEQARIAIKRGFDKSFANFFAYRAARAELTLRDLFRNGRRHLLIGLPLLVVCLLASQYTGRVLAPRPWGRIVEESFVILGWVANWKPIEVFLYDWWPIRRDLFLYRRLAAGHVEIRLG